MIGVTTAIIQDKRIKTKDNTYAIKLRITYQRIQKYYPLGYHFSEDDWKEIQEPKPRKKFKDDKIFFNGIEQRAIAVIKTLDPFSFEAFNRAFNKKTDLQKDVFTLFEEYISLLKGRGQIGTADSYTYAKGSFKTFLEYKNRKRLSFGDITPEWLQEYEDWMLSKDNAKSITTVGIYCRCIRRIINNAIEEGIFNRDFYPFGKNKYQIPAARNIKKSLSRQEIKKVIEYQPKTKGEEKAKDLWYFSFLCNGLNFKDIVNLQYNNINYNRIEFIREKIKRTTKRNSLPIVVNIMPEIDQLINKWGVKPIEKSAYIFGFISSDDDEEQRAKKMHQARKVTNKNLKKIGEKLKLPMELTHGVARYCWATLMKQKGVPESFIGEGLGHKNSETTKHYLSSFDDETRAKYQEHLTNF